MSCKGDGFARDALHQVAVAHQGVDIIIDDVVVGAVVVFSQEGAAEGQPDRVGRALAERAGGCLYPWRQVIFGVAGCATAPLAGN